MIFHQIAAVGRALWLALRRDRGALLMAFVLPALFFLIMAEIFTAATGANLALEIDVYDQIQSDESVRLTAALAKVATLTVHHVEAATPASALSAMRSRVGSGAVDVGLVLRADADSLVAPSGFGRPPLLILSDPSRGASVPLLAGHLRAAYFGALPDVAFGNVVAELEHQFLTLSPEQRAAVAIGLDEMRRDAEAGLAVGWSFDELMVEEPVVGGEAVHLVAYSAGAVAFMFLLFAAVQGATTLLEEEESGILDRVLAGPGGIAVLVHGKGLFLLAQGAVQLAVIFLVAWWAYDVDVPGRWAAFVVVSAACCLCATGFALLVATASATRRQAQAVASTVILVLAAVGGSMVPRFFMPPLLQDLGWLTPNTWALEAYSGLFWRAVPLTELLLPLGLLIVTGAVSWWLALWFARRRVRLD